MLLPHVYMLMHAHAYLCGALLCQHQLVYYGSICRARERANQKRNKNDSRYEMGENDFLHMIKFHFWPCTMSPRRRIYHYLMHIIDVSVIVHCLSCETVPMNRIVWGDYEHNEWNMKWSMMMIIDTTDTECQNVSKYCPAFCIVCRKICRKAKVEGVIANFIDKSCVIHWDKWMPTIECDVNVWCADANEQWIQIKSLANRLSIETEFSINLFYVLCDERSCDEYAPTDMRSPSEH